jgi:hypothetical protein
VTPLQDKACRSTGEEPSGELERAKHALPLDSIKEQELVVQQDTHHSTSWRDGGSVVSVVHQHRRLQAPSFRLCELLLLDVVGNLRLYVFPTF